MEHVVMFKTSQRLQVAYYEATGRLRNCVFLAEFTNLPEFKTSLTAINNWD